MQRVWQAETIQKKHWVMSWEVRAKKSIYNPFQKEMYKIINKTSTSSHLFCLKRRTRSHVSLKSSFLSFWKSYRTVSSVLSYICSQVLKWPHSVQTYAHSHRIAPITVLQHLRSQLYAPATGTVTISNGKPADRRREGRATIEDMIFVRDE